MAPKAFLKSQENRRRQAERALQRALAKAAKAGQEVRGEDEPMWLVTKKVWEAVQAASKR